MKFGQRVLLGGFTVVAALLLVDATSPLTAYAQQKGKAAPSPKDDPKFRALFAEVVTAASRSTVRIQCDGKDTALGVVVQEDGFILTKASDLTGKITVKTHEGIILPAQLIGRHDGHDLAMLKVEAAGFVAISWSETKVAPVGHFVASVGPGSVPVAVGVVSVPSRELPPPGKGGPKGPAAPKGPMLGVTVLDGPKGVMVAEVLPNSTAESLKVKVDDFLLAVGDAKLKDIDEMRAALAKFKAGDALTLRVLRGTEELELKGTFSGKGFGKGGGKADQNSMGSELSKRRTGFSIVLQHDSVVLPIDCGGPLVDLEGRVIGINIARAGRVESWAIPAEVIRPLLPDLISGKLAPKKQEKQ
jgi:serine protease Do